MLFESVTRLKRSPHRNVLGGVGAGLVAMAGRRMAGPDSFVNPGRSLLFITPPMCCLDLGIHGAILPFILAPAGFLLGRSLGFLQSTDRGFIYFGVVNIHFAHVAIVFPAVD